MTNTDSRDLDRACAEAMGMIGGRWSTDPAALPEMLQALSGYVKLERAADLWNAVGTVGGDYPQQVVRSCATLNEAVARLVVAVAQAKKERKQ